MGQTKKPKGVASNISSSAKPAASSTTQTANKSSILRSSFSPSRFQLSLFASVIQGFDSPHLRIHETTTGRLQCDHAIGSKTSITCLDWGYHGANYQGRHHKESQKKRKRTEQINGALPGEGSMPVIAFGTSDSEIHLFSPAESKVVKLLGDAHIHGVRDFKFREDGLHGEGWSVGGDGKIVQWDLRKGRVLRSINLPHGPAHTIRPFNSSVICASHNAYIFDTESREQPPTFTASTNTVHTIMHSISQSSKSLRFLTAAETDHFIPVFDADSPTLIGSLPTESEVLSLDSYSNPDRSEALRTVEDLSVRLSRPREALLVVNKDGALEIFPEPFDFGSTPSKEKPETPKARAQRINRKRAALVRIRKEDKRSTIIPLVNASFQGSDIAMAWAEGGVNLHFDKIQWLDEDSGNLILKDETDIMKEKRGAGVKGVLTNGVKDVGSSHVDESRAVVANGGDEDDLSMADEPPEVIEISSGQESESEDELPARLSEDRYSGVEGDSEEDEDVNMDDTEAREVADPGSDVENDQPEVMEEPSFGELIRANAPEAIDVQASFADPNAQSLVPTEERHLQQLPSGMSLAMVLSQSLRTNDTNLLETCFHVKDLETVRATIERLDSSFATLLLQKLAERLHSRPGRAGSLLVWVQWTLVAHGGYLAGQPEVMKKLVSLHRVVKDRASSLQSLLSLKGKLDMLEAQMNLRKSMQSRSRAANALEEDDEEGVIYVEGQDESDSEEEDDEGHASAARPPSAGAHSPDSASSDGDRSDASSEGRESGDEMPNTSNGIIADSEDEDSGSEAKGLFDEEASSTDHDSVDEVSEDDVDHESVDSVDSSDADASPPPKRPAKSKLSNGIGPRKR